MTPEEITRRLRALIARQAQGTSDYDLSAPEAAGRQALRPAAVLMAVDAAAAVPSVILTQRSSALKHHPGQIALPGGKKDPEDADLVATALREAREEVGLASGSVEVLGLLPAHETVTGFEMVPVIGLLTGPFTPVPEPGEVAEVFRVPLAHIISPASYFVEARRWRGTMRSYYVAPYGPYYIWGATARVLHGIAQQWETL